MFFTDEKNAINKSIKTILKEYDDCKKILKKYFNKNLIKSAKIEERFQYSNKCWICDKLFDVEDNKVRDNCHKTIKYRGSAHWNCNITLKLANKVAVIFHNLKSYDSHLKMMMMVMMNCFCDMVDQRKAFSLISSRDHCQRFSPPRISNTS